MNWTELKRKVYYEDNSCRQIYVLNATVEDWKKWINYVNRNYRTEWFNGKTSIDAKIDLALILEYWNGYHDLQSTAIAFIDQIQVKAHFYAHDEIENDINPADFNSMDDHDKLMKYMTTLSVILGKEMILTAEDEPQTVLLKVRDKTIEYYDPNKPEAGLSETLIWNSVFGDVKQ